MNRPATETTLTDLDADCLRAILMKLFQIMSASDIDREFGDEDLDQDSEKHARKWLPFMYLASTCRQQRQFVYKNEKCNFIWERIVLAKDLPFESPENLQNFLLFLRNVAWAVKYLRIEVPNFQVEDRYEDYTVENHPFLKILDKGLPCLPILTSYSQSHDGGVCTQGGYRKIIEILARNAPHVTKLYLKSFDLDSADIATICTSWPSLTDVHTSPGSSPAHLGGNVFNLAAMGQGPPPSQSATYFENLANLQTYVVTWQDNLQFLTLPGVAERLKGLNLAFCQGLDSTQLNLISTCVNLESLSISKKTCPDLTPVTNLQGLKKLALTRRALYDGYTSAELTQFFMDAQFSLTTLRLLRLKGTKHFLPEALSQNPQIEVLIIERCQGYRDHNLRVLSTLHQLRKLFIEDCRRMKGTFVKYLTLESNPSLEVTQAKLYHFSEKNEDAVREMINFRNRLPLCVLQIEGNADEQE